LTFQVKNSDNSLSIAACRDLFFPHPESNQQFEANSLKGGGGVPAEVSFAQPFFAKQTATD
jgi:hypothetical protein